MPAAAAARFPMPRLLEERDLHMDMLREAGRRSDAHVIRYDWASKFVRPNDVVLDAACGLGYGTYAMRYLSAASRFFGIDSSGWAIDYATACFGSDNTEYIAGFLPDALSRFEDASVDVVVSFETLEHVEQPAALLAAFGRVLRPGGRIIVSVPNDWSDETGEDPNPHHLHVYTYERLAQEMAVGFTIEQSARQIASGCKHVDAHCQWVERPRVLEVVEPANGRVEAEWWLAVAMKSPQAGRDVPYRETVHGRFEGATHLVDFDGHYTNPWLVHAMVEIPYRLQRADALKRLAEQVRDSYPSGTADHGAALAVLCYRALEEHAHDTQLERLDGVIAGYLALSADNPHIRRWQVSLTYARARLRLRRGDRCGALADFSAVARADVAHITPTLGTKVIEAAFQAGRLSWLGDTRSAARDWWRLGLTKAGHLIGSAWCEFFGNIEAPFIFAMNDAVEIVDRATACAQALSLTHSRNNASAAMLYDIGQQSLRSALRQRDADLDTARANATSLRNEFDRVCGELRKHHAQKASLEQTSMERLDQILALEARLRDTDAALDEVKAQSVQRLEEKIALEKRIEQTDAALQHITAALRTSYTELAAARAQVARLRGEMDSVCAELQAQDAQKSSLERTSLERLTRIHELEARLEITQAAFDDVQTTALERLDQILALDARLRDTDAALDEVKLQSMQRLAEKIALEKRIEQTDAALEDVKQLSIDRLKCIETLAQQLRCAQAAVGAAVPAVATCPKSLQIAEIHSVRQGDKPVL
ncbi:methyltransferase domain-containing protein [Pandoraea oxalativorans]|uniref:methyltransferase domain-containing protein n=1 Tax=Pandoraea oxalativorans TaxID=573737 RepID=UPI0012F51F90|nr:methyltransferase domain-containing protein [Pandoraea oxalativorans]